MIIYPLLHSEVPKIETILTKKDISFDREIYDLPHDSDLDIPDMIVVEDNSLFYEIFSELVNKSIEFTMIEKS